MINSELLEAVKTGDVTQVASLVDQEPALLTQSDENGATPMHYAALYGHRDIVRHLADKGADINHTDGEFGATPAGWAIEYIRELGGVLAVEIDDVAYAIQQQDVRWVARLLRRYPTLREQADASGVPLRNLANSCGSQQIADMFS